MDKGLTGWQVSGHHGMAHEFARTGPTAGLDAARAGAAARHHRILHESVVCRAAEPQYGTVPAPGAAVPRGAPAGADLVGGGGPGVTEVTDRQAAARAKAESLEAIQPLQLDSTGSHVVPSASRPRHAHLVWIPLQAGDLRSGWACSCRAGWAKSPCWHTWRVAQLLGLEVE